MAKIYHPDKQSDASPEEKERAEREFLKIAQAYEVRYCLLLGVMFVCALCFGLRSLKWQRGLKRQ